MRAAHGPESLRGTLSLVRKAGIGTILDFLHEQLTATALAPPILQDLPIQAPLVVRLFRLETK